MAKWDFMLKNYYTLMGWDPESGRPLDETLKTYDLDNLLGTHFDLTRRKMKKKTQFDIAVLPMAGLYLRTGEIR